MLSLDEPLDLKLPSGHINLLTLTSSLIHAKRVGPLAVADNGTEDIIQASPASGIIGNLTRGVRGKVSIRVSHPLFLRKGR